MAKTRRTIPQWINKAQTIKGIDAKSLSRDFLGRQVEIKANKQDKDHYFKPGSGKIKELSVQCMTMNVSDETPYWDRFEVQLRPNFGDLNPINYITKRGRRKVMAAAKASIFHLLYWIWEGQEDSVDANKATKRLLWYEKVGRYFSGCCILFFLLWMPASLQGESRNGGNYDPVRYRDWKYSKHARNRIEDQPDGKHLFDRGLNARQILNHAKRPLWPKKLCYILADKKSYTVRDVDERTAATTEYVFISYAGSQFTTRFNDVNNPSIVADHRRRLTGLAIKAARDADVSAFWIDIECVTEELAGEPSFGGTLNHKVQADVYRLPDIVRSSKKLCIVLTQPTPKEGQVTYQSIQNPDEVWKDWLKDWGGRMWCLPEILSTATEKYIDVYVDTESKTVIRIPHQPNPSVQSNLNIETSLPGASQTTLIESTTSCVSPEEQNRLYKRAWSGEKRKLIELACKDLTDVREILHHQEGQATLSPLELMRVALRAISWRENKRFTPADEAYVLKALVRRQPQYVKDESGFEAFASISFANDSASPLERLACLLPNNPFHSWMDWTDQFLCEAWDVKPDCQVAGIVNDHSVLLDGAKGASIQWDRLDMVHFAKRPNILRTILELLIRILPLWFFTAVITIALDPHPTIGGSTESVEGQTFKVKGTPNAGFAIGLVLLLITLLIIFTLPITLLTLYRGKIWQAQALLIGIEGKIEKDKLGEIETRLFGSNQGHLTWSTNGSLYSRHKLNEEFEERVPLPPNFDAVVPEEEDVVSNLNSDVPPDELPEKQNSPREQRFFTLIDTNTREATVFKAFHPPTAAIVCGQEGGMQRVALCSYDWKTRTYYRESVIRMKTLAKDKMSTIDRFRFALQRPNKKKNGIGRQPPQQQLQARGPPHGRPYQYGGQMGGAHTESLATPLSGRTAVNPNSWSSTVGSPQVGPFQGGLNLTPVRVRDVGGVHAVDIPNQETSAVSLPITPNTPSSTQHSWRAYTTESIWSGSSVTSPQQVTHHRSQSSIPAVASPTASNQEHLRSSSFGPQNQSGYSNPGIVQGQRSSGSRPSNAPIQQVRSQVASGQPIPYGGNGRYDNYIGPPQPTHGNQRYAQLGSSAQVPMYQQTLVQQVPLPATIQQPYPSYIQPTTRNILRQQPEAMSANSQGPYGVNQSPVTTESIPLTQLAQPQQSIPSSSSRHIGAPESSKATKKLRKKGTGNQTNALQQPTPQIRVEQPSPQGQSALGSSSRHSIVSGISDQSRQTKASGAGSTISSFFGNKTSKKDSDG